MWQRLFFIIATYMCSCLVSDSQALKMHVKDSCGCAFDSLQVEVEDIGNVAVGKDGSVELDVPEGTMVAVESDIRGFWCPIYACRMLVGDWTEAQEGGVLGTKCLKKPLKQPPCFINMPKLFGWI